MEWKEVSTNNACEGREQMSKWDLITAFCRNVEELEQELSNLKRNANARMVFKLEERVSELLGQIDLLEKKLKMEENNE